MNQPLVSVIIPCYNQGEFLRAAIDSVYASTYKNVEIIVVDDGSTDANTKMIIGDLKKDASITVIQQSNRGLPSARNAGIGAASGDFILPLDADDVICPTFIMKAAWRLAKRSSLGIVYCLVQLFGDIEEIWKTDSFDPNLMLHHNFIPATALYRRIIWEQVGGYHEGMRNGYEDWEFWIRCVQAGWVAERINEPLFKYRRHGHTMLHASRKNHASIVRSIREQHRDAYTMQWRVRLAVYYAKRKFAARVGRIKNSIKNEISPRKVQLFKRIIYRLWPKALMTLPPPEVCVTSQYIIQDTAITKQKMGLIIVLPWLQIGGVERVMLNVLSELDNTRFRVYLFTTLPSEHPWEHKFEGMVQQVFHLASMFDTDQDRIDFLCDFIQVNQISCVHISNSAFGYAAAPFLKRVNTGIKIIDTLHMEEPYEPWDYVRLSDPVKKHLDKRVVVTPSLRERLILAYNNRIDDVVVIENGIQLDSLKQLETSMKQRDSIVFVGRFVEQKQPHTFLKIAIELNKVDKSLRFVLVGDGPLRDEIQSQISRYGATGFIHIESADTAWEILHTRALVLVAPSIWEGLPMIGLECMGLRVPIVASAVPGWSDLIQSGVDGVLIPFGDIGAFCAAILNLLKREDVRRELCDRAYDKLELLYLAKRMSKAYQDLYLSLTSV